MLYSHKSLVQQLSEFAAKLPIYLTCVLFFVVPKASAQDAAEAQAHSSRGILFARARNWAQAEQELRTAVRDAPLVAAYHVQLGSILGLEGKWGESLTSFQKATELEPSNAGIRRDTAAVQWHLGLLDAAERNVRYILNKDPSDPGANLLLGLVSDARGDYVDAARLLSSQFDLAASQPDRAIVLFRSMLRSGQKADIGRVIAVFRSHVNDDAWTSAISQCSTIAAMADDLETSETLFGLISDNDDSDQRAAGLPLAALRYRTGHVAKAQELLTRLIQRGWVSADAQTLLGTCFESERQPGLAIEAYLKAIEIDPFKVARYDDLISLQLESGHTNDAIAWANRAIAVAPQKARAWVLKGNVEFRGNAYKNALESYMHAAKLDASNPDTVLLIGGVHFISGDTEAAIAEYTLGIARFPNDPRFYVNCAEVLLGSPDSLERQRRAEALLKKAIHLAPHSAEAHYQLGHLSLRQGRLQDAENEFSASLQSEPNRSKTHYAISLVYRRMGKFNEAEKQFALYQDLKHKEEDGTRTAATAVESRNALTSHVPHQPEN